jgi:hypothetical protein
MNVFLCITYEGCQENQKELFLWDQSEQISKE